MEHIVNLFCGTLKEHGWTEYTKEAVREIVETSLSEKENLYKMFKTHPNWDENQLCIHFDRDIERKFDANEVARFITWLRNFAIGKDVVAYTEKSCWGGDINWRVTELMLDIPRKALLPTDEEYNWSETRRRINSIDEKWNFRAGMKLTRVINKICQKFEFDKVEGFDREFARFADAVTPRKIVRHTTISINPIDFLLMSNGNSWNSCHYIGDEDEGSGCHCAGTISYMMDPCSFIVSVIDKEYSGTLALAPKVMRQVFGYKEHQLLQSRLYPQNCDSGAEVIYENLRSLVEEIIAEAEGEPNRWVKANMNAIKSGAIYPDWRYHSLTKMWVLRNYVGDLLPEIEMGKAPLCIKCGYEHTITDSLNCNDCREIVCADCGRTIDLTDEDSYIEDDGYYYCSHCRRFCEKCKCTEFVGNLKHIEDRDEDWCEWCASRYAAQCDECGKYFADSEELFYCDGAYYCEDCFESKTFECEECGGRFRNDDKFQVEGRDLCWKCEEASA